MFKGAGFLGTGASLGADLTLVVQTLFFIVLTIGVVAQRFRKYKAHDLLQTSVVVLNFFFIIFLMVASFSGSLGHYRVLDGEYNIKHAFY